MGVSAKPAPASAGLQSFEFARVASLLLALAVVGLAWYLPRLGLVGDDWWLFAHASDGDLLQAWSFENPARPMAAYVWTGLWKVLGLNVGAYYLASFGAQWLSACLVFVFFQRFLVWTRGDSLTAAAFFLLYPPDTAHPYLSTISTRLCVLWAILGGLLWLGAHSRRGAAKHSLIAGGLILMLLSLLAYESPLFLLGLLPLVLAVRMWQGFRPWARQAWTCYVVLGAYLLFRLWVAVSVARRPERFYVSIQLTPDWLFSQWAALLSALTWKGGLYSLKSMFDMGAVASGLFLATAMAILLPVLFRRQETAPGSPGVYQCSSRMVAGLVVASLGSLPAIVSSVTLDNAVGTLDGRLIHASAIGHGILMTGVCALPGAMLALQDRTKRLVSSTMAALLLSMSLVTNLMVQRQYASAWQAQLRIADSLLSHASFWHDSTAILLLEAPAGPFDVRFYYPLTQMMRRLYSNPTLHLFAWQSGFPASQQTAILGRSDVTVVTEMIRGDTARFEYERLVVFRVMADESLEPAERVDERYFLKTAEGVQLTWLPPDWRPAQGAVSVASVQSLAATTEPPETEWRRWLLSQIEAGRRLHPP